MLQHLRNQRFIIIYYFYRQKYKQVSSVCKVEVVVLAEVQT